MGAEYDVEWIGNYVMKFEERNQKACRTYGVLDTTAPSTQQSNISPNFSTRCGFCAHEFSEVDGEMACGKCAHFGGCKMVMCPRCGYEMPQTPKLIKMLRQWRLRRVEAAR